MKPVTFVEMHFTFNELMTITPETYSKRKILQQIFLCVLDLPSYFKFLSFLACLHMKFTVTYLQSSIFSTLYRKVGLDGSPRSKMDHHRSPATSGLQFQCESCLETKPS